MGGFSFDFMQPTVLDLYEEERKRKEQEQNLARLSGLEQVHTMMAAENERNPGSVVTPSPRTSEPPSVTEPGVPTRDLSYLDQYAEHLRAMPRRSDYEPSTLRKILSVIGGTLAGGNPAVTEALAYGKHNKAMRDWQESGAGLGALATEEGKRRGQDVTMYGHRVKRVGDVEEHERGTESNRISDVNAQTRIAELEEQKRSAKSDEEAKRIDQEINKVKNEIDAFEAQTGRQRADTYGRNVDSLVETRDRVGSGYGTQLTPSQELDLDDLALNRVLDANPEWEAFVVRDNKGNVTGFDPANENWFFDATPEQLSEYDKFMQAIELFRQTNYPGSLRGQRVPDIPPPAGMRPLSSRDR